ncbi:MAG TPA: hypothetical protein VGL83_16065 [Stellaceae bacterium]|jgi:hypothetical protein
MLLRLSARRSVSILLAALCLALGALAATELGEPGLAPQAPARNAPPDKARPAIPAAAAFALPPVQSFAVVTERPLFSPDRKPPQHADDSAGAWSSFVLTGVIITPQSREALVLHGKPPTVAHVEEGQALEGWTVASIFPDHVVFRDGLDEHELKLIPKAPPPGVSPRPRLPRE